MNADGQGWRGSEGRRVRGKGGGHRYRIARVSKRRAWENEERGMSDVVQTLWGFCHTLRHDGIDYGDYIEQITYLLFLKMADERGVDLPKGCDWPNLREKTGTDLTEYYVD